MRRRRMHTVAGLTAITIAVLAAAAPITALGIRDAVIVGTNSVDIEKDAQVTSGLVVVNARAPAATLDDGVELSLDTRASVAAGLYAEEIHLELDAGAAEAFCLAIDDLNGLLACQATPFPVYPALPELESRPPPAGAPDFIVGNRGTAVLAAGDYGVVDIGRNASVTVAGGQVNVASFKAGRGSTVAFAAPTTLRVAGRLHVGANTTFGPAAGSGIAARHVLVHVAGSNGVNGGLLEEPLAADLGGVQGAGETFIDANVYAANGTLQLKRGTNATGAFIARDVEVEKEATVALDSGFNLAPVAHPLTVFTSGGTAAFDLTATDGDGDTLTFSLVSSPDGTLNGLPASSPANPVAAVPVTYSGADGVEDRFEYAVADGFGGSDTATVFINPSETCTDDTDCDPGFFCDTSAEPDPICVPDPLEQLVAQDGFYETAVDTPIENLILSAQAPDDVGDLEFEITAPPPVGEGSVSTPPQPVSPRSARVTFTPALGFTGQTSFDFEACEAADPGNCDQATITVDVQTFTPPAPPVAVPQEVTTTAGTEIEINLAVPIGAEEPAGDSGREGCGNGQLDPGEECDDGNLLNGDGCDDQCNSEGP